MKKITILLSILLSSQLLIAENNVSNQINEDANISNEIDEDEYSDDELEVQMWNFSANVGMWFMGWGQCSTASKMLKDSTDALRVNYNISDSMATTIKFHVSYDMVSANIKYYNDMNPKSNEKTTGASLGLSALDFMDNFSTEVRIVKAQFDGKMSGAGATASGKATFNSDLAIMDFIIYPYNHYVGLGYRTYKYEFPQDFYLIRNSDSSIVPIKDKYGRDLTGGLANVEYKGHFYTLVVDNQRLVSGDNDYKGLVYSAMVGRGKLTPNSPGLNRWMTKSDAKLIELSVGYTYNKLSYENHHFGVTAGYRYNKISTQANKNSGKYSLLTEFKTEFYGPFVNLSYNY